MLPICRALNQFRSTIASSTAIDVGGALEASSQSSQLARFHRIAPSFDGRDDLQLDEKSLEAISLRDKRCARPLDGRPILTKKAKATEDWQWAPIKQSDRTRTVSPFFMQTRVSVGSLAGANRTGMRFSSNRAYSSPNAASSNYWMYSFPLACIFLYLVHKSKQTVFAAETVLEELKKACQKSDISKLKSLMGQHGENKIIVAIDENNLLHQIKDFNTFTFLIEKGADIQKRDRHSWTPFHYAVSRDNLKVVEYLWTKFPDQIAARTGSGWFNGSETLLHIAARYKALRTLRFILDKQAFDINVRDKSGWTPLHWAVYKNCIESARILMQRKSDVNAKDNKGQTPLHVAAKYGHFEEMRLLLNIPDCDVNARDNEGNTPLHLAVQNKKSNIIYLLIEAGADPAIVNHQGKKMFDPWEKDVPDLVEFKKTTQAEFSNLTEKYYLQGSYDLAEKYGWFALEVNPENVRIHDILGEIFFKQEIYDRAVYHFKKNVDSNNRSEIPHFKLAEAYLGLGNWTQAILSYSEVLKLNPKNHIASYQRGLAYKEQGKWDLAIKDIVAFLSVEKDSGNKSEAWVVLGRCYQQLSQEGPAKDCFQEAKRLVPDHPSAQFELDLMDANLKRKRGPQDSLNIVSHSFRGGDHLTDISVKYATSAPSFTTSAQSEKNIKDSFLDSLQKGNINKFLEDALRNRNSFTKEELDNYLRNCEDQFLQSFDHREQNPILIDETMDEILNLSVFGICMAELRETLQFKYEQHLNRRNDYLIYGKYADQINMNLKTLTIPTSIIEMGEGFHPCFFLPLRIRSLFSLYIRIKKDLISVDDLIVDKDKKLKKIVKKERKSIKKDLLNEIKKEILCEIETFRSSRDLLIIQVLQKELKKPLNNLLAAHIENVKKKILDLNSEQGYVYASGHGKHSIYVNFSNEPNHISLRIDNLGEGIVKSQTNRLVEYRHQTNGLHGREIKFYPCLIKEMKVDQLDGYLKGICQSQEVVPEMKPELWNWIYPGPCEESTCWPASEPQQVGNCTVESHNVGYEIRLGTRFYQWIYEKELTIAGKLRTNPELFRRFAHGTRQS